MKKYLIAFVGIFYSATCYGQQGNEEYILQYDESTEASPSDFFKEEAAEYSESELDGVALDKGSLKEKADKLNYNETAEKEKDKKSEDSKADLKEGSRRAKEEANRKGKSIWNGDSGKTIAYSLVFVLLAVILVYFVLTIRKRAATDSGNTPLQLVNAREITEEFLTTIQPDEALENALREGNYGAAVRILYLRNLKVLMEKGLIRPARQKTNREYVRELKNIGYRNQLAALTRTFEASWYGELPVNRSDFAQYREQSDVFFNQVRLGL